MACAPTRLAAIDIGTVTSRLMVADTDGVSVHPVAREYEVTNLGEGVDATGIISEAALERVEEAVDNFLVVRDRHSAEEQPLLDTVVMATSAARDARNADAFVALLAERGLTLQVISGDQEAELTFAGVTAEAAPGTKVAVVDVGGGSTEVSFGVAGEGIHVAHSFDIGCRRMTERFLRSDPPTGEELEAARAWAADQFEAWRDACSPWRAHGSHDPVGSCSAGSRAADAALSPAPQNAASPVAQARARTSCDACGRGPVAQARARSAEACGACPADAGHAERSRASANSEPYTLFAVAGTATSAISMVKAMEVYDSAQVHGAKLTLPELEALLARLAAMTEAQRERVTGLDPRRAPVIVAGLLILSVVMRTFGFDAFTASESDILQGMILWAAQTHGRR